MSYRLLSSNNSTTNVYLVFGEVTITPYVSQIHPDFDSPNARMYKTYRHADGSLNASNLGSLIWKDPGTHSDPLIFPDVNYTPEGLAYDKDYILHNIRKYFEPFDVNVYATNSMPDKWDKGPNGPRYVKILPPGLNISGQYWNALPPKFYPFKRATWWQQKQFNPAFDAACPWNNFASIGYGAENIDILIMTAVHEIGHLYNLSHQGDMRHDIKDIRAGRSYYSQSFEWLPIMGASDYQIPIAQWSNTDYIYAVANGIKVGQRVYENELTEMLKGGIKLKKPPGNIFAPTRPGPNAGLGLSKVITKDPIYARYATSTDSTEIIGMIGYEKDYDIIKILLPGGSSYTLSVEPYLQGKENRSMLDPRIEILYCQSDIKKTFANEDSYPNVWIPDENSIPNLKNTNIFHKILIENDEEKNVRTIGTSYVGTSGPKSALTVDTSYTTLVYVKVMGNWKGAVNRVTKKPLVADQGYSNYGSIGKYKLELSEPSLIKKESYSLPYGRFEEFTYCKNGANDKAWLLVQDSSDNSQGDPSKKNMWVLELDCIINGQTEKKKFIVYGDPVDIDAYEEPGKFYLPVIIEGECKKQEFILGMPRPEENE